MNWPVVYLIKNDKELYIGETTSLYNRSNQHYDNPERRKLDKMYVITDEEYNKSAALDIESSLIQYIAADGKFYKTVITAYKITIILIERNIKPSLKLFGKNYGVYR